METDLLDWELPKAITVTCQGLLCLEVAAHSTEALKELKPSNYLLTGCCLVF